MESTNEMVRRIASEHAIEHEHKTAFVDNVGWLCADCYEEDFVEFLEEFPAAVITYGKEGE